MKTTCLSFALLSALTVSAHAACVDKICTYTSIGIGGLYNGSNATGTDGLGVSNVGGHLVLEDHYLFWQRLKLGGTVRVGFGGQSISGNSLANFNLTQKNTLFYADALVRLGYNIISPNVPLFVNVTVGYDFYHGGIGDGEGLHRSLYTVGAEIQGDIPIGQNFKITYGVGYNWIGAGWYNIGGSDTRSVGDYAAYYSATLGFQTNISERVSFYLRAVGKYYDLPNISISNATTTANYPTKNQFSALLEFGIGYGK